MARTVRRKTTDALFFLDLDRFKLINDSLGHDAGDQLLRVTAQRLKDSVREIDHVFRMSGDEFIILLEDLERPEQASIIAERILENMAAPISLSGCETIVNASIGITYFPQEETGADVESLIREADSAMYAAKQDSEHKYQYYDGQQNENAMERLELERDLKKAISQQQFFLVYQPKICTDSQQVVSVEGLLRWKHPERGVILPGEFIPILEETGLIGIVGSWVINEACRQAREWKRQGIKDLRVSVNVSAKQFRNKGLINVVEDAIKEYSVEPQMFELELTESMFIENIAHAVEMMQALKSIGVCLSVDDFGSGYSSMSYLKDFPLDYLKIDRSFIQDITNNPKDAAITQAISSLGKSLSMSVIAEGVETAAQVEFLHGQWCQEIQGYYYGYPMPAEIMSETLKSQEDADAG